ncbi:MAG: hypothetical protein L3J39_11275 [Verrucomicrobiales bacterium]|nr:hypothetical protein [Verrucomicrobiales bacterium]
MILNLFKRKKNKAPNHTGDHPSNKNGSPTTDFKPVTPLPSAEERCQIDPKSMDKKAIREHLKTLYKRHNEAAASLDPKLRDEAEAMLDAIVECREKYIDS